MKAMIFAAGLGTRLRPITYKIPKALVPYNGKPLLQHVIERLKSSGFNQIIINIHHFADKIIQFIKQNQYFGINIVFSDEREQLLDTGGGLAKAKWFLDGKEPFLVHNVDIITDLNLQELYNSFKPDQLALLATQNRPSDRVLIFSKSENFLCGWKNKTKNQQIIVRTHCPAPVEMAFSGIHIIHPRIFKYLHNGKYSIISAYLQIARTEKISFFDHSTDFWKDIGKIQNL